MRTSPLFPFVLLVAGFVQAFPFVVGRSMEYSVQRRWGAERSVVTLLPVGRTEDTAGTRWKIRFTDSLVAGVRADGSLPTVRTGAIELLAKEAYSVWADNACEVPWDLGDPMGNSIPLARWPWGVRALACAGIVGSGHVATVSSSSRRFVDDRRCDRASPLCGVSYVNTWNVPNPEGIWSGDSGWISYHDGETGESWALNRIGEGPDVPESRRRVPARRNLRVGDRWTWSKIVDWRSITTAQSGRRDTASGSDTTRIEWIVLERIGDTGAVGIWKFSRKAVGREAWIDTVQVDFDTPFGRVERKAPGDLALAVFQREAKPWDDGTSEPAGFEWSEGTSGEVSGTARTIRRSYALSRNGGVSRMVQEATIVPWGMSALVFPQYDSTVTLSFVSRDSGTTSSSEPRPARMEGSLRSHADIDRLLAEGGQILSIRDLRGTRLDGATGGSLDAARRARGVLFVDARTAEGAVFRSRILRP